MGEYGGEDGHLQQWQIGEEPVAKQGATEQGEGQAYQQQPDWQLPVGQQYLPVGVGGIVEQHDDQRELGQQLDAIAVDGEGDQLHTTRPQQPARQHKQQGAVDQF